MKKSLLKDSIRQIKNTFKRFLSILLIVLLGVGFFAGMQATSPDMKEAIDEYFDAQNMMDIEVISTLGLTYDDINALKNIEGVSQVNPAYSFDASINTDKKDIVVKIESIPEDINKITLLDGKLPDNYDECVVEEGFLSGTQYNIGEYITINPEKMDSSVLNSEEDASEDTDKNSSEEVSVVKNNKIKIVGTVKSPQYISRSRGTSKLGSGTVNYYMYIPKENINMSVYTVAYVTADGAIELETYNEKYDELISNIKDKIEEISEERKQTRYEEIVNEATEKLNEAQQKLNDARTQISKIKKPTWYILDRNSNYGYVEYIQDTDRIANISKVFPAVFFIVAALISLTSMSRMIEEQRVQIGTLKALGYNKIDISIKYIIYALLATMIGGIIGMSIGFYLIPNIIWSMYEMMYTLPEVQLKYRLNIGLIGLIFALICTLGATIYTCINQLKEKPANLMLPRAPKPGKRILLEKIKFIWSRFKFTQKVTARNIFRYKKKFLMTIIGVAGCTALIVAGFSIRDSVSQMIPKQYGEIFKYDGIIILNDDVTNSQIQDEIEKIGQEEIIDSTMSCYMKTAEITNIENSQTLNLVVINSNDNISNFINIRSRKNKTIYSLDNEKVIISEKIAKLLNIKVGDKITIKNTDNIEKDVIVGAISETYINHYIYMSSNLYNTLYGENSYKPNTILIKEKENTEIDQEEKLGKTLLDNKDIASGVSFLSNTKDVFGEVMDKMQLVVYILIISAALLAFAVLYNLSNVNISERIKELATLKVLGFYNKEVFNYITKETRILTGIGIIWGLVAGYFLGMYIIKTCELDMLMFVQEVKPMSFVYGFVITIIFAEIVNIAVKHTLKKISMADSLKSVD